MRGNSGQSRNVKVVLDVDDPAEAGRFYEEVLGWERAGTNREEGGGELLRMPGGELALLLQRPDGAKGDKVETLGTTAAANSGPAPNRPAPGDRVYVLVPDGADMLDAVKCRAEAAGAPVRDETEPFCWRTLTVTTPEGYRLAFWKELEAAPGDIAAAYASGPERLEAALAGLDESALDWALAAGKWSIRQQVLHLVDLELASVHKLKYIAGSTEPDRVYTGNRFTQDEWAEAMRYADRPVVVEMALFRLLREHVLLLYRHIPGIMERSVRVGGGRHESAIRLMKSMAGHANTHIRRILEIRELFGR
ncbi:DinB family protein [Paenibacillus sp. GYB004]|uniref:DinB family protein n=1 Tax=Paenibacillus sp. GYB004 TaxID=2994393 RepID=UPI002F963C85